MSLIKNSPDRILNCGGVYKMYKLCHWWRMVQIAYFIAVEYLGMDNHVTMNSPDAYPQPLQRKILNMSWVLNTNGWQTMKQCILLMKSSVADLGFLKYLQWTQIKGIVQLPCLWSKHQNEFTLGQSLWSDELSVLKKEKDIQKKYAIICTHCKWFDAVQLK